MFTRGPWTATLAGIEMRSSAPPYKYDIPASRLLETVRRGGGVYNWPVHVGDTKQWAELEEFIEVFDYAIKKRYGHRINLKRLARSYALARKLVAQRLRLPPRPKGKRFAEVSLAEIDTGW